jgi:uncharacterized protein YegP (UPF0339 family)
MKMSDIWKIYTDSRNKWCWYKTAKTGRMVGASSQHFETKEECIADAKKNGMQDDSPRD